jgi:poly-gamma-glutamate synthesis protein (capsule biosynthesis protein)
VPDGLVTVFLCGDVMTGRGVDQILPHPGDRQLWETYLKDARAYVKLAEDVNGPISAPVDFSWPWGDALELLDEIAPDVRVVNLETVITRRGEAAVGKAVLYRMNPDNLPCLTVARPNVCTLANNHVLDFGRQGLEDTLDAVSQAGLRSAGAGRDASEAERPAFVDLDGGGRVVVLSFGTGSSGVPRSWAATADRPGVAFLRDLSKDVAAGVVDLAAGVKRAGDVVVASIHWGSNWGHAVPSDQVGFAHRLVDGGVDIVHGHSSHHSRPIEVYRGKLILYGCGDLINDYEGIGGYEEYRDDLRLLYFASLEPDTGRLSRLRMAPMQARQMRLCHASTPDAEWMRDVLNRVSSRFSTPIDLQADGTLTLHA